MNIRTWTRFDGLTEEVEVGSEREKELSDKMHQCGLWEKDDPNKPEGCLSTKEFEELLTKEKKKTTEQRYQEYLKRKERFKSK